MSYLGSEKNLIDDGFLIKTNDIFVTTKYLLNGEDLGKSYLTNNTAATSLTNGNYSLTLNPSWNFLGPKNYPDLSTTQYYIRGAACDSNGNLYVTGSITNIGGVSVSNLAKWNGKNWSSIGTLDWTDVSIYYRVPGIFYDSTADAIYVKGGKKYDIKSSIWSTLGNGFDALVYAYDSNNSILYAASSKAVARLDGNTWTTIGDVAGVYSMVYDPINSILYAGGGFTSISGVANTNNLAKWNGSSWSSLGGFYVNDVIRALAVKSNGHLYVGGQFSRLINKPVGAMDTYQYLIRWDGSNWYVDFGGINGNVLSLLFDSKDNLYVGGQFTQFAGLQPVKGIVKWNGSSWSNLSSSYYFGYDILFNALALDSVNNKFYATGAGGLSGTIPTYYPAAYGVYYATTTTYNVSTLQNYSSSNPSLKFYINNNSFWSGLKGGVANITTSTVYVYALTVDSTGNVYAGGSFTFMGPDQAAGLNIGAQNTKYIAKWNVNTSLWESMGNANNTVNALVAHSSGNVYAGGSFTLIGSKTIYGVAKYSGTTWTTMGTGQTTGIVYALAVDSTGNVYAGGTFTSMGGVPNTKYIAKWINSTQAWSDVGGGLNGEVDALAVDSNGNVYAGGIFTAAGATGSVSVNRIAKYSSSGTWTAMGTGQTTGTVSALAVDSTGNVYAGGSFTSMGGAPNTKYIAKWVNNSWSGLGGLLADKVLSLSLDSNRNIYVGGTFSDAGVTDTVNIAKWNITTSTWSSLGVGSQKSSVNSLAFDSTGNLYAGGSFTNMGGITGTQCIAKWNNTLYNNLSGN